MAAPLERLTLEGATFALLQDILLRIRELAESRVALETTNRQQLAAVNARLTSIEAKIMTLYEDIQSLITDFDSATNEIATNLTTLAAKIEAILAQIKAGLTAEEANAIRARLSGEVGDLRAQAARAAELASDPADPIPQG